MPNVQRTEKLYSVSARKRFGRPLEYGCGQFGVSVFGDEPIELARSQFGIASFGGDSYGDIVTLSGVYQKAYRKDGPYYRRLPYYVPKNPRTEKQQANRMKFKAGMEAWATLAPETKESYNLLARKKGTHGWSIFLKQFLSPT